ncbi:choice-of-anchor L domain-containing protein [Agromyces albus]|uniref:Peptidase n=1 Tax=Agromyces albus TaxID=205332 RepID=A0A4Q2KRE4_9MICO|nr:choice-of-anchor L domain-containing protein [Agromyces albus]RXZ68004.1 peptidase [Agromyces albus]
MRTHIVPTRRRGALRPLVLAVAAASLIGVALGATIPAGAAPEEEGSGSVQTLRETDADKLAKTLAGHGVKVSDASFAGTDVQGGLFTSKAFGKELKAGVALSSGSLIVADPQADSDVDFTDSALLGPNSSLTTTGDFGGAGDEDLTSLAGATSYDAAVLTFTAVPKFSKLQLAYAFGSEEYANWSAQGYNDAVGIWVDGELCSAVPGTADAAGLASINATTNSEYYVANFTEEGPSTQFDTELNAFTTPLTCSADVEARQPVTIKIAVADTRDGHLDSALLVLAKSLVSTRR